MQLGQTSQGIGPWYQPWLFRLVPHSLSSSSSCFLSFSDGGSNQNLSLENLKGITRCRIRPNSSVQTRKDKKLRCGEITLVCCISPAVRLQPSQLSFLSLQNRQLGRGEGGTMDISGIPTLTAPKAQSKTQNTAFFTSLPWQRHCETGGSLSSFCVPWLHTNKTSRRSYCIWGIFVDDELGMVRPDTSRPPQPRPGGSSLWTGSQRAGNQARTTSKQQCVCGFILVYVVNSGPEDRQALRGPKRSPNMDHPYFLG